MSLNDAQKAELRRLAQAGKMGSLNDLAAKWGVEFKIVARTYAEFQREAAGVSVHQATAQEAHKPQELTDEQKRIIRRLAEAGNSARLVILAEDWGVESRVLSRYYNDCRAELSKQIKVNPDPAPQVLVVAPVTAAAAAVEKVTATPGAITVLPRNWPLIQARIASGYTTRDIALAVGLAQTEYQRIEEGRQLPTPDQAAKICALLKLELDLTFVIAGQEALYTRGHIRGLSILGILRARARQSMKDLAATVTASSGTHVSTTLISLIERGQLKRPLAVDHPKQIEALAAHFGVTAEVITAQVPPGWIDTVIQNTAALHGALKQTFQSLPAVAGELQLLTATSGVSRA